MLDNTVVLIPNERIIFGIPNMKKFLFCFFASLLVISPAENLSASTYDVAQRWFSDTFWGDPITEFSTDSEAVYFNFMIKTDGNTPPLDLKWFDPDGIEEADLGTDTAIVFKYSQGILIGIWGKMLINGMDRKQGMWRVEHYAYGNLDGITDWHLMLVEYFQIGNIDDPQSVFDGSGAWNYTESNTWSNCDGGDYEPENGSVIISKAEGIISMEDNGLIYTGSVNGNTYTLNASYPDDIGTVTIEVMFTLTSSTMGSGTVSWEWSDSSEKCNGGHNIALTRTSQDIGQNENLDNGESGGSTACFISYCLRTSSLF